MTSSNVLFSVSGGPSDLVQTFWTFELHVEYSTRAQPGFGCVDTKVQKMWLGHDGAEEI